MHPPSGAGVAPSSRDGVRSALRHDYGYTAWLPHMLHARGGDDGALARSLHAPHRLLEAVHLQEVERHLLEPLEL